MEPDFEQITSQARTAATELLDAAGLRAGDIFVVGCSSSEVLGGHIGKASSREAAEAVFSGIYPVLQERGIYLAAQCCEHLNRALILEGDCADKYGYEPVCVVPQPKAGGSFATKAWQSFARGGGARPGPRGAGYRRHPHRDAPAGGSGACAAEPGPRGTGHPAVRPHPAQIHRREPCAVRNWIAPLGRQGSSGQEISQ